MSIANKHLVACWFSHRLTPKPRQHTVSQGLHSGVLPDCDRPHGPGVYPRWHGRGKSVPQSAVLVRSYRRVLSRIVSTACIIAYVQARRGAMQKLWKLWVWLLASESL